MSFGIIDLIISDLLEGVIPANIMSEAAEAAAAAERVLAAAAEVAATMEARLAAALSENAKLKDERLAEKDRRIAELEARQGQAPVQPGSVQPGTGRLPYKTQLPIYAGSKPRDYDFWDKNIAGMLLYNKGASESDLKFQMYANIKGIAMEKVQDLHVGSELFESLSFQGLRDALFERLAETSDPATDWAQFLEVTQDSEEALERYFDRKRRAFEVAIRRHDGGAVVRHCELIQQAVMGIKHAGIRRKAARMQAEVPPIQWIDFMAKVRNFRVQERDSVHMHMPHRP